MHCEFTSTTKLTKEEAIEAAIAEPEKCIFETSEDLLCEDAIIFSLRNLSDGEKEIVIDDVDEWVRM